MRRSTALLLAGLLGAPAVSSARPSGTPEPVDAEPHRDAVAQPQTDAEPAPSTRHLLAQLDDPDLKNEETLDDLMDEEFAKDSKSMAAAIGLSFVPGGGWGLVYAGKKAQAVLPILISAAGFVVGGLYIGGVFDTNSREACRHVPTSTTVDAELCGGFSRPPKGQITVDGEVIPIQRTDPNSVDELPYFRTEADYQTTRFGKDFDGMRTGIIIVGATYATATILGAVWAGSVVSELNDRLRKDIESTAGVWRPVVGYDGNEGVFGLALDF